MRSRVPACFWALALSIAVVAAGCLGGTRSGRPRSTPTAAPPAPTAAQPGTRPQPTPTAAPQGTPRAAASGGTFTRLWADPPTLDPHLTSDTTSAGLVVEIFSGLVALDTDLKIIPDIAERWDLSGGGAVFTFRMRDNVKFHNGKAVTASDLKYSFERVLDPRTESPVADTYLNDIVGAQDKLKGQAREVRGVRVIDDRTLEITIDAPKPYFIAKLTYPTAYAVDRQNVESGSGWTNKPNGTGPFKLTEWTIGQRIVLERNQYFYRGVAKLDRVRYILSGGVPMTMYENNEIDLTGVGQTDLDRVLNPNEPLNKQLVRGEPSFEVSYIGFHVAKPPFDDKKVRQAFTLAIDKEAIAREVLSNLAVPAYGVLPPGFPGHNPNIKPLRFDPVLAKRLLAESKYGGAGMMPRVIMTLPGTGGTVGLDTEAIIEMWKQNLGVAVEIQQTEWATYLQDLNRQRFQMFGGIGWAADYPDPQDFVDILFHSKSFNNHGAYNSPQVDRLLEQARTEQDSDKRIKLYQDAEQMVVDDAVWIPLWYTGERYVLIKPYVKGYKLTRMIVPKLKDVYIERQ
ncbi:MAG: peptide ABC transporter substrate-binding protein [Chloroflexi bacterium]|nr:peptide ABC transporter substrate-binding protein [Chloroflexota bacterium]